MNALKQAESVYRFELLEINKKVIDHLLNYCNENTYKIDLLNKKYIIKSELGLVNSQFDLKFSIRNNFGALSKSNSQWSGGFFKLITINSDYVISIMWHNGVREYINLSCDTNLEILKLISELRIIENEDRIGKLIIDNL